MKRKGDTQPERLVVKKRRTTNSEKLNKEARYYHLCAFQANGTPFPNSFIKRVTKVSTKKFENETVTIPRNKGENFPDLESIPKSAILLEHLQFDIILDHLVIKTEQRRKKREEKSKFGRYVDNDDTLIARGRPKQILSSKKNKGYDALLETVISKEDLIQFVAVIIGMGIRRYKNRSFYFEWNSEHLGMVSSLIV